MPARLGVYGRVGVNFGTVGNVGGRRIELFGEAALVVADDDVGDRLQQDAVLRRQLLGRAHEDSAGAVDEALLHAGGDQSEDLVVELLAVSALFVVPDDQVDDDTFEAQVGVGLDHLADQVDVGGVGDTDEGDGMVAGDRLSPQS